MNVTTPNTLRALCFDVFGTVVDWRSTIIEEGQAINQEKGIAIDWEDFADQWRSFYQPSMEAVRSGRRAWANLDSLHRESLEVLLPKFGIDHWNEAEKHYMNAVWHRLKPWPDSVAGLSRLKQQYTIATISNGNVALLVDMAKHSGLPWDMILGAEVVRHYKPLPEAYLHSIDLLGLKPEECCMVAAHNSDLVHAANHGMQTAFVARSTEYGPNQKADLEPENTYNYVANSFTALAEMLGC